MSLLSPCPPYMEATEHSLESETDVGLPLSKAESKCILQRGGWGSLSVFQLPRNPLLKSWSPVTNQSKLISVILVVRRVPALNAQMLMLVRNSSLPVTGYLKSVFDLSLGLSSVTVVFGWIQHLVHLFLTKEHLLPVCSVTTVAYSSKIHYKQE